MPRIPKPLISLCLMCALSCPVSAQDGGLAGPIWGEGPEENGAGGSKDAGASVETSQEVSSALPSSSGGTLTQVRGKTSSGAGLVASDLIDLYRVQITNGSAFSVKTNGSTFDTVVFLFRETLDASGTSVAIPVMMNDDADATATYSQIGPGLTSLTAGFYYIGVAKSGAIPLACSKLTGSAQLVALFSYTPGQSGIVFPNQEGQSLGLCDWSGSGNGGDYTLSLTGTVVARSTDCESAITLGAGTFAFGNPGITELDSARIGLGSACNGAGWIANPSWFRLGACDGETTVSLCPTAAGAKYTFVVYEGSCGNLSPVACGVPQACSAGITGALASFSADPCRQYLIAFGPIQSVGATLIPSSGTITISCAPAALSCGDAAAGSCFSTHSTPSCDSASCCSAVCAVDSFCCSTAWDATCRSEAFTLCAPPPACPPNNPDLDGDGVVSGGDLALLLSQWGSSP